MLIVVRPIDKNHWAWLQGGHRCAVALYTFTNWSTICTQLSCDTTEDKELWMKHLSVAAFGKTKKQPSIPRYSLVLDLKSDEGKTKPMSELTPREITLKYRELALQHHPDRFENYLSW
jgi:hypothetical protein